MNMSIKNNFVLMTIFFSVSSLSIPIENNNINDNSTSEDSNLSTSTAINTITNHSKPYNTNTIELNKFVLSIINAYDENADQHLNIIELKKMLTNPTIMKKVENIFTKRLQSKPNVIHHSTKIIQEIAAKTTPTTSEMVNKKNMNLKSIKKKKVLDELDDEDDNIDNTPTT